MSSDTCTPFRDETSPDDERSSVPFIVFSLYTFILVGRPQDYLPALAELRPALFFTVLTSVVTAVYGLRMSSAAFRAIETRLYVLFFAIMCAGIPFSIYRRGSFDFVILQYVVNVVYYLLFLVHVATIKRLRQTIVVVVLSALAFNCVWIAQGGFKEGRFSSGVGMFDPNDLAFVEVSLLSLGVSVLLGGYRVLSKSLALLMVLVSALLALYSGSRGGAIALVAWFVLFLALPIPRVSKVRKLVLIAVVVALGVLNIDKINLERYSTLMTLEEDYNFSAEGGRTDIWKVGLRALWEKPLTGVGADCFGAAIGLLREREGRLARWQTAHNSYVQVAVETGVFGGAVFLLLIGACLANFNRLRKSRKELESGVTDDSRFFMIGFVALLLAAFFLSQGYSMLFTLYFALSAFGRSMAIRREPCDHHTRLDNDHDRSVARYKGLPVGSGRPELDSVREGHLYGRTRWRSWVERHRYHSSALLDSPDADGWGGEDGLGPCPKP